MRIVAIFDSRLFSFRYPNEKNHELKRLLKLWNNPVYIIDFITQHAVDAPKGINALQLATQIENDAVTIDDYLLKLGKNPQGNFEFFFKSLDNNEFQIKSLSKRKGRKNYLRLYAIRIDNNCFVITGGAIKFTKLMQDKEHTKIELQKLERCREFLKNKGILDAESYFEFIQEQNS